MALWHLISLLGALLFSQSSSAAKCCFLHRRHVQSAYRALENMGGLFPRACLRKNTEIPLPTSALNYTALNQKTSVLKAVYTIMEHSITLLENDTYPESWDQETVEDFQIFAHRMIKENNCKIRKRSSRQLENFSVRKQAVETYFDKLTTHLRNKENSVCAWEVVRKELQAVFHTILQLDMLS